jgi:nucleoside-diphosphate-sugar epimerase
VVGARSRFSIVHVADLAQGIRLAAESALPGSRAYFFTDGEGRTIEELSLMMAGATGQRTLRVPVPVVAVAVIAAANELAALVTHRPPLIGWRMLGEAWHRCWLVSDRRSREELGYQPTTSTERGMAETAAWYRAEGWL